MSYSKLQQGDKGGDHTIFTDGMISCMLCHLTVYPSLFLSHNEGMTLSCRILQHQWLDPTQHIESIDFIQTTIGE